MDEELFRQAVHCLNQAGIRYWVDGGTLLGMVRDGALIPWDLDFDFGVWRHEVSEAAIIKAFEQRGFVVCSLFPQGIQSIHVTRANEPGQGRIDIVFYTRRDGSAVWHSYLPRSELCSAMLRSVDRFLDPGSHAKQRYKRLLEDLFHKVLLPLAPSAKTQLNRFLMFLSYRNNLAGTHLEYKFPAHYFENLRPARFLDVEVTIPEDAESFLALAYGSDWRTPKQWEHWWQGATHSQ